MRSAQRAMRRIAEGEELQCSTDEGVKERGQEGGDPSIEERAGRMREGEEERGTKVKRLEIPKEREMSKETIRAEERRGEERDLRQWNAS